jgi:hypothetical protein
MTKAGIGSSAITMADGTVVAALVASTPPATSSIPPPAAW